MVQHHFTNGNKYHSVEKSSYIPSPNNDNNKHKSNTMLMTRQLPLEQQLEQQPSLHSSNNTTVSLLILKALFLKVHLIPFDI